VIRQLSFLDVAEPKDHGLIDESAVVRQHNLRVNAEMEIGRAGDPGTCFIPVEPAKVGVGGTAAMIVMCWHCSPPESMSRLSVFEVAVKILLRTNHQQLECVPIQNAVSKKAQQVTHAELVSRYASQIADFGFAGLRLADIGSN